MVGCRTALTLGLAIAGLNAILPGPATARSSQQTCAELLTSPGRNGGQRSLRAEDLLELIDIGDPAWAFDSGGLSLSPDKTHLSFPVRRAVASTNSYCQGIMVLDLRGTTAPKLLDTGGEVVRQNYDYDGTLQSEAYPLFVRAKWSPDGQWLAYQKRVAGVTQLWRVRVDGGFSAPIAGTIGLKRDFAWSTSDVVVTVELAGLDEQRITADQEALRGFRYDERFLPHLSDRPMPRTPMTVAYRSVEIDTGLARSATAEERALLDPPKPEGAVWAARGRGNALAWGISAHPQRFQSDQGLWARFPGKPAQYCGPARCDRIDGLWWSERGNKLIFIRREGWARSRAGVYVWKRGQSAPTREFVTDDLLIDCQLRGEDLVCGRESSQKPRRIVALRLSAGTERVLYDPNPGFAKLPLGRVERLQWRNQSGVETFGDLVYPIGYTPRQKYPVIVTTYSSRGFLRGATGDEYPIQLFAGHGFAVLSLQRPSDFGANQPGLDRTQAMRIGYKDWADRQSVQSSIERGLDLLERKGIVAPGRIGITGLSDGTSTVQYALLNSKRFAAAAMSSCCLDVSATLADTGLRVSDRYRDFGFPALDVPPEKTWSQMSITLGAKRIHVPILMQMASEEFRLALSAFTALRGYHRPVDMYVFPDEGHIKLQPAHRLAICRRNTAWFEYWLKNEEDSELSNPEELEHWRDLKAQAGSTVTTGSL